MGESEAAEETVSGGQEEGGYGPESGQALVSSSPQGCICHPGGRPEIPPSQAPEEGSTRHSQSSGTKVRREFDESDDLCKRKGHNFQIHLKTLIRCPYGH